jgi:hypothetical protein
MRKAESKFQKCTKEENGEAQQFCTYGPKHRLAEGLGPPRNWPGKGGREVGPLVRPHPHRLLLAPHFSGDCMAACRCSCPWFPYFPAPNHHHSTINWGLGSPPSHTTSFGASPHYPHLYSLVLALVVFESKEKATLRACLLGTKIYLGMNNTMQSSSIFKLSYYSYSNAYELEYSCFHVIIMIYELVYGLDVMILTCSTLFLIIHMTCMSRSRTRVKVTVCRSFRFAHILAFNL